MLSFRVSHLDIFREWEENEESDLQRLIKDITDRDETDDMRRGTAFHKALENHAGGEVDCLEANGYRFLFDGDFLIPQCDVKEIRCKKNYYGVEISGQVDAISGKHIIDHKAATWFDAERYFKKYAWRYYLDIFNADRFTWYVWEMQEADDPLTWIVRECHKLEQWRYPEMEQDCKSLAMKLKLFAYQYLVEV